MLLALFVIWLVGAVGMFILDGYFDFDLQSMIDDESYGLVLFACAIWWLVLPFYLVHLMRQKGKLLKEEHKKKEKEAEKLRVAVQKDIEENMKEVELDMFDQHERLSKVARRR